MLVIFQEIVFALVFATRAVSAADFLMWLLHAWAGSNIAWRPDLQRAGSSFLPVFIATTLGVNPRSWACSGSRPNAERADKMKAPDLTEAFKGGQ